MSELDRYCRLCLSKESVVAQLFDDTAEENGFPLFKKVIRCVSIKVRLGDGLPALLCQTCADRVQDIWSFRERCEHIDGSLRKFLKQNRRKFDGDWEDRIQSIAQESVLIAPTSIRTRKKPFSKVSCTQSLVKHGKENTEDSNSQNLVKVETVLDIEDEDEWPLSPSSPPSPPSPSSKSSKEDDSQDDMHHGKQKKKKLEKKKSEYTCEFCGRVFPRSNHLAQHELTHTAEKPFECSECKKSFWYKASLIGHIKQTHTGDVNYTCELCGKGFFKKTELTRHKPTHSNETPHKCPQCGMGFKIPKTLKRHIQNVHTAQRSHTCHTCGKSFTQLQTLKVHLVLHSGVKPYVCSYCGKGFSQSAPLKTHIRIHTGERPYSCHACGDTFATRSALTSHAFKHSGTLPYPCTRCLATFRLKRDLIQHEQGHDDEESKVEKSGGEDLQGQQQRDHSNQQDQPIPPATSSNIPHPIPVSHTVGRPNPPMIHRQQSTQVNDVASKEPTLLQVFTNNLLPVPSAAQVPALSHMQPVSQSQLHPSSTQSYGHPQLLQPTHFGAMYSNQL